MVYVISRYSHFVLPGQTAVGPMFAVVSVLEVDLGFADQVIGPHQIPIVDLHRQHGFHGEGGFHLETSEIVDGITESTNINYMI